MDFYISEQEVREKIPDMTGRKRGRPAQKSLFHAGLMDFLFFHADQQKMIFRNKGRTETFRGSTEFYGEVRRGTEKSDISFLLSLQFLFPLLRLQITPSVILRTNLRFAPSDQSDKSDKSDKKLCPVLLLRHQGEAEAEVVDAPARAEAVPAR